jgi:hypothetical protein
LYTQLSYLNNAQHSCLTNMNLWNNKFCMDLEWTHEAYKFVMKGTIWSNFPERTNPKCFIGKCCLNQKKNYTIGKFSKHKYLKWSCVLDLKLWPKSYDEKKSRELRRGQKNIWFGQHLFPKNFCQMFENLLLKGNYSLKQLNPLFP